MGLQIMSKSAILHFGVSILLRAQPNWCKKQDAGVDTLLTRQWRIFALQGLLATGFGLAIALVVTSDLRLLVLIFGFYALADSVCTLTAAVQSRDSSEHAWTMFFSGAGGIAVELITFGWPRLAAWQLPYLVALWAIITVGSRLAIAFRLQRAADGKWLLVGTGMTSLFFGLAILVGSNGVFTLSASLSIFAVVLGLMTLAFAIRLRLQSHVLVIHVL